MQSETSFEAVYTAAVAKCPQLAPRNTHIVHEWIAKGYDVAKDILPAIEQATKRGTATIQSFAYFSGFIRTMNERRVKEAALRPAPLTEAEKDRMRARTIEIKSRAGFYISDADENWLKRYREKNGAIA